MAIFESRKEKREVIIGLTAGVISGVASIVIASNYIATKASEKAFSKTFMMQPQIKPVQTEYIGDIGNIKSIGVDMNSESKSKPKLTVSITTSEFYNGDWNPVLIHTFYGDSEEELAGLINAHRTTDAFFRASFEGVFNWKGTQIKLKNSEPKLEYV